MKSNLIEALDVSSTPATTSDLQAASSRRTVENYTVQQAAALTGLSEHTLRYYEKIGLIQPVLRQESSGHRRYSADDLAKLETLACLRATGMPIEQMRLYFELRSRGADASEQQALLSTHLEELQRRMAALQDHIKYVQLKIDYWRAVGQHDEQAAAQISIQARQMVLTTFNERS